MAYVSTYDAVFADISQGNYTTTLNCPHDVRHSSSTTPKQLCPFGVAACCQLQLFHVPDDNIPAYTGLLTPNTILEHCIIRLSSAIQPPSLQFEQRSKFAQLLLFAAGTKTRHAQLFPTAAIKVFRHNNRASGNLLFGGCKVGQAEEDYFAHCQCTQMTKRMPRTLRPLVNMFAKYSKHPLSLGVSDFCALDENGKEVEEEALSFPFCIILSPCQQVTTTTTDPLAAMNEPLSTTTKTVFDTFIDEALKIPIGTPLFDVFACPNPSVVNNATKLQRIGRITTSSEFIPSNPNDGLFFRHQVKEEDYQYKPEWKRQLKTRVTMNDGTVGTVEHLAGWELFEQHISKGEYVDFEKLQQQKQESK